MSQLGATYRWSPTDFLRAHDAGAFEGHVELVEGEVWPVVIGSWHWRITARLVRRLPEEGVEITLSTLPSGNSLPDPDCWVHRADAEPRATFGQRLSLWRPDDVLLVVEISDESLFAT